MCFSKDLEASQLNAGEDIRWYAQIRALIRIALPLALSQLSEMSMSITDTALLGGLGATALAVGGLSTSLFFVTMVTFQAGLGGASVLIAQARGRAHAASDNSAGDLSGLISAGFLFSIILCVPVMGMMLPIGALLHAFGEPDIVVHSGSAFMHILLLALLPDLVVVGLLRIVLPAFGSERLLLWTMPGMAIVNGFTNATLIHGWFGLPTMGLWGSAAATVLTGWSVSGVLLLLIRYQDALRPHIRLVKPDLAAMRAMARLGLPMIGSTGAEVVAFQVTGLRAGQFGTTALAAHQVTVNVTAFMFMVSLALSQSANIRVSFWLGARRIDAAKRAAFGAVGLAILWSVASAAMLIIFPGFIVRIFLRSGTQADILAAALAVKLLHIGAVFQLFDGIQVVCAGALRGCHDTFVPMMLIVVSYVVLTLGMGSWLANSRGWGVEGLWWGLASGLAAVGLLLPLRLIVMLKRQERTLMAG